MYIPEDVDIIEMITEHAYNRVARMDIGDVTSPAELFGSALWYSFTDLEKHYLVLRYLEVQISVGELDLEFDGLDADGQRLYRKFEQ